MDFLNKKSNLINETIRVAQHAGRIVLEIYNQSGQVIGRSNDLQNIHPDKSRQEYYVGSKVFLLSLVQPIFYFVL